MQLHWEEQRVEALVKAYGTLTAAAEAREDARTRTGPAGRENG